MAGIVIVALPKEDEPVWEYSSEKKPHMTLLYMNGVLSDEEAAEITKYVQHASNVSLNRFGLSVDRRGTLGDEDADVLFFDTTIGVKQLREFRSMLLKNDVIAKNYVKVEQFPGWIPHLTMGYPNSPAKEVAPPDSRYLLNWINFDRIAIWFDNYEGPEFELSGDTDSLTDNAYWSEDHGVHIMHFGVKGMRWGVRRETDSSGRVSGSSSKTPSEFRSALKNDPNPKNVHKPASSGDKKQGVSRKNDHFELQDYSTPDGYHYTKVSNGRVNFLKKPITGSKEEKKFDASLKKNYETRLNRIMKLSGYGTEGSGYDRAKERVHREMDQLGDSGVGHRFRNVQESMSLEERSSAKQSAMDPMDVVLTRDADGEHSDILEHKRPFDESSVKRDDGGQFTSNVSDQINSAIFNKIDNMSAEEFDEMFAGGKNAKLFESYVKRNEAIRISSQVSSLTRSIMKPTNIYKPRKDNFNPKAKLDTSQVIDDGKQKRSKTREVPDYPEVQLDPKGVYKNKRLAHSEESIDDVLMHFGVKGMRWGVRRPLNSSGIVTGSVDSAIKGGQKPKAEKESGSVRSGKKSADQKRMERNLKKDISSLSTKDIQDLTKRIQAIKSYKAETAAQKEAQRSVLNKIGRWAAGNAFQGAKSAGESFIKEAASDAVRGVLPETNSGKARRKKEEQAQEDRDRRIKKEDEQASEKARKERESAVKDLVETIMDGDGVYRPKGE